MNLQVLARTLGAELCAAEGQPEAPTGLEIAGVAGLEHAGPQDLSFVSNLKYTAAARSTLAAAVLAAPEFPPLSVPTLRVANPYLAFARAVALFHQAPRYSPGIHPTAAVEPSARIAPGAHIGPYAVVGAGARVGPDSVLLAHTVLYEGVEVGARFFAHAHAVVREGCLLGDDVTLGNGVVVGSDGFGFARYFNFDWHKIEIFWFVVVGSGVEIQANSCIDRASIGQTTIAPGVKIDNLVQVGHGSSVGEQTLLCAQVGLAGSSRIGRDVILAGQVGVAGHLTVGDGAVAPPPTGIPRPGPAKETVSGYPALPNRQWLRSSAAFARLPEMLRRLGRLERLLAELTDALHRN